MYVRHQVRVLRITQDRDQHSIEQLESLPSRHDVACVVNFYPSLSFSLHLSHIIDRTECPFPS